MKTIFSNFSRKGKSRIDKRLDRNQGRSSPEPVINASNIHFEVSDKTHGISCGGIGAIHSLVRRYGLAKEIDSRLHLLKFHSPYHESDHVLAIGYNTLCGGTCLQDLEQLRMDENFLNALDAARIPDPTTAGDFCRRFKAEDIHTLQGAINAARLRVWAEQPEKFFDRATIDMDGTLVETTGQCKEGMDVAYEGTWGYHPLVVSLAETREVLSVVNRPGNRPSHEGAAREATEAVMLCLKAGFRQILLRGDTDFSQSAHLDGWDAMGNVRFIFGFDAISKLKDLAGGLPEEAWRKLQRPVRYEVKTEPRRRPENVKDEIVKDRGFEVLRLKSEDVAEFDYQPTACGKPYRMVVVRKNITKEKGEQRLFDEIRYFFYITNERDWSAEEVVFSANDRCNQENLIAQLKSASALRAPVNTLEANWAYMVTAALAWTLKAWFALALPTASGRWRDRHERQKAWVLDLEFRTFLNTFILLPSQIVKTGRKVVYRLLAWKPHIQIFFRLVSHLRS